MVRHIIYVLVVALWLIGCADDNACASTLGSEVFARRIAPLLSTERPASCGRCHLAGTNLASFARGSACETFACMAEQGLVDRDDPAKSRILSLIGMKQPASSLITDAVVAEERAGFLAWIQHESACGECVSTPCPVTATSSLDDPRWQLPAHAGACDTKDLAERWRKNVWPWMDRCGSCHNAKGFAADLWDPPAPHWLTSPSEPSAAERTLANLLALGAVDLASPSSSTMLTKPLAPSAGGIAHGGSVKFEDKSEAHYQAMLGWIQHYASCHGGPP